MPSPYLFHFYVIRHTINPTPVTQLHQEFHSCFSALAPPTPHTPMFSTEGRNLHVLHITLPAQGWGHNLHLIPNPAFSRVYKIAVSMQCSVVQYCSVSGNVVQSNALRSSAVKSCVVQGSSHSIVTFSGRQKMAFSLSIPYFLFIIFVIAFQVPIDYLRNHPFLVLRFLFDHCHLETIEN